MNRAMSREKRPERRRPRSLSGDRVTDRTPLVLGTHHVAIICSDNERSKHFFIGVLGLEVINDRKLVAVKLGGFRLAPVLVSEQFAELLPGTRLPPFEWL